MTTKHANFSRTVPHALPTLTHRNQPVLSPDTRLMYSVARSRGGQRGAVLVLALIFLVLITILALTASSSSMMQLRMSGNLRNAQQAQMSAATALRGAEWQLWTSTQYVGGFLNCTDGSISADGCVKYNATNSATYGVNGTVTRFRHAHGWIDDMGVVYKGPGDLTDYTANARNTAQLDQNPRYIIEDLGRVRPPGVGPQRESDGGSGAGGGGNVHSYRITARATGGGKNSIRVLQSTFDAQTNN